MILRLGKTSLMKKKKINKSPFQSLNLGELHQCSARVTNQSSSQRKRSQKILMARKVEKRRNSRTISPVIVVQQVSQVLKMRLRSLPDWKSQIPLSLRWITSLMKDLHSQRMFTITLFVQIWQNAVHPYNKVLPLNNVSLFLESNFLFHFSSFLI
jgi:hypothetical protein